MNTEIEVMDKTIKCLALELHEVVWKDVAEKWNAVKLAAASTVSEPLDAISFVEWFVSDNNPYPDKYSSDDDNDGKWHDSFSEGINRHYYTTEQLYQLYKSKQ